MGSLLSRRQHDGVEEIDVASTHAYKYPPRSGMEKYKNKSIQKPLINL